MWHIIKQLVKNLMSSPNTTYILSIVPLTLTIPISSHPSIPILTLPFPSIPILTLSHSIPSIPSIAPHAATWQHAHERTATVRNGSLKRSLAFHSPAYPHSSLTSPPFLSFPHFLSLSATVVSPPPLVSFISWPLPLGHCCRPSALSLFHFLLVCRVMLFCNRE